MDAKKKAILDRIEHLESDIAKARAYLESGKLAHLPGSYPLFTEKERNGKTLPPHKDWVKSKLLPWYEGSLKSAKKALEKMEEAARCKGHRKRRAQAQRYGDE